jgi:hypothetical protein
MSNHEAESPPAAACRGIIGRQLLSHALLPPVRWRGSSCGGGRGNKDHTSRQENTMTYSYFDGGKI